MNLSENEKRIWIIFTQVSQGFYELDYKRDIGIFDNYGCLHFINQGMYLEALEHWFT